MQPCLLHVCVLLLWTILPLLANAGDDWTAQIMDQIEQNHGSVITAAFQRKIVDYSMLSQHNIVRRTPDDDGQCPPCFNCMLPMFKCQQYSECNEYTGKCDCIAGFAGDDCSAPLCGGLDKPNERRSPRGKNNETSCACDDGWTGINCNICTMDSVCDAFMPDPALKGTCYQHGMIVNRVFQGCNVTNSKILDVLGGSIPQVTFTCDKSQTNNTCTFQFWIDEIESFYCGLDACQFVYDPETNSSHYKCDNARCSCVPGTTLCGAKGSIDISDFLTETIKGPGEFNCNLNDRKCQFKEPSMNDLIKTVFGDPYITLECKSGECVHYSEIPGYKPSPDAPPMSWQNKLLMTLSTIGLLGLITVAILYISKSPLFRSSEGKIHLPVMEDDTNIDNLLQTDMAAALTFENISYHVAKSKGSTSSSNGSGRNSSVKVLNKISGVVDCGEILAIMGGSGAGKTTLLDILAMKRKIGEVEGSIKINGQPLERKSYQKLIGFVDQDDYLLPTLTVYETVLNSALLRLPRRLSFAAKEKRVYEVLEQLRIIDIKDRVIGHELERGISGGEKRRVSIACELVTSPLILFLDEPTSGLDANNANNVIECLVSLARDYKRTLILTIHQPRSNIFNLFNKLILLNQGDLVYSGNAIGVNEFLINQGYSCPKNYNIADYLIDITFQDSKPKDLLPFDVESSMGNISSNPPMLQERGTSGSMTQRGWEDFAEHRDEIRTLLREEGSNSSNSNLKNSKLSTENFVASQYNSLLLEEIKHVQALYASAQIEFIDMISCKSKNSANYLEQLSVLCSRSFKNCYRNPRLLAGNYLLVVLLGVFLGTLYYNVDNTISGFQNRMGLFFFVLTYFGFVTLTGLSSFAMERIIFLRERANNYYGSFIYLMSKLVSDILPLRVIPPIILSMILYPIVKLNMTGGITHFWRFTLILTLFNVGVSLEILTIGIIVSDLNNSLILSVILLLCSLLFSGLFVNLSELQGSSSFQVLPKLSIFHYAYEALLVNEVKDLTLRERKYGLNIEIPGATILSTFGFEITNLRFDIYMLATMIVIFTTLSFLSLKYLVIERK